MSAPRLPFLWPMLFAPRPLSPRPAVKHVRRFLQTATTRRQGTTAQRYGTANEPVSPSVSESASQSEQLGGTVIDVKALSRRPKKDKKSKANASTASIQQQDEVAVTPQQESAQDTSYRIGEPASELPAPSTRSEGKASQQTRPAMSTANHGNVPHLPVSPNSVLDMPPSESLEMATVPGHEPNTVQADHRAPHMNTPPYVHHFDTWGLVQDLEKGGWTREQSITTMKTVRQILLENMTLATEALVSKSNVENETYLFRAACSELKTEISTKRKAETEKSGTQRTQLQHEVDILSQKLDQQGTWLKDELKGMFDDRKMAVRNEQRSMESKIQELNYRITIALNSDSRSDVEGVRWIITKRALAAIGICVLMVLSSLKYSSVVAQAEEESRKRHAESQRASSGSGSDNTGRRSGPERSGGGASVDQGRREEERARAGEGERDERRVFVGEVLVKEGDNPSFVSLG